MTAASGEPHIGLVVEGPGDRGAIPILVRKHLHMAGDFRDVVGKPLAANGLSNLTRPGGIEGFVRIAAGRPGCRAVLVIVDGDGKCVVDVAASLVPRMASRVPTFLVVADRDVEDWIFASAEALSISGIVWDPASRGLGEIRAALRPSSYTKPVDQPSLAAKIDLDLATQRSASFARFRSKIDLARALT